MNNTSEQYRILILEDEFIIADTLTRHLQRNGHEVVGAAIAYEEAVALYQAEHPDLALLDIRISGARSGIDFARYLRSQSPTIPFIFLTSQVDMEYIDQVKQTYPSGYLSKPVQMNSLLATMEVAMFNYRSREAASELFTLRDGRSNHRVPLDRIEYIEADHVYVKVYLSDNSNLVLRRTLGDLISELGDDNILQTHRSFAVNPDKVTRYDKEYVYLGNRAIPVSRTRRQFVADRL